jgi:AcrR family transcriptional regulator
VGITERKERLKSELRQTIIDAALKIFVAEGYEKTSIRSIAEAIEYSPGTIYLHFKDKDELLFAVHEVAFGQFFECMAPLILISNARERLLKMGEIYIQFAYENPELYGLMFMDKAPMNSLQLNQDNWDCGQKAHQLLHLTVQQTFADEHLSEVEIDTYTMTIWAYVHGLASLGIRDRFCIMSDKGYQISEMTTKSLELMLDKFLQKK